VTKTLVTLAAFLSWQAWPALPLPPLVTLSRESEACGAPFVNFAADGCRGPSVMSSHVYLSARWTCLDSAPPCAMIQPITRGYNAQVRCANRPEDSLIILSRVSHAGEYHAVRCRAGG
jgi:hypothetical protein